MQIVRINGSSNDDSVVVIGAHLDRSVPSRTLLPFALTNRFCSTNNWPFLPAPGNLALCATRVCSLTSLPGADDDGSGSMSILEAYRGLVAAGFQPERAVEFHWYSAEVLVSTGGVGEVCIDHNALSRLRRVDSSDLRPSRGLTKVAV